MMLIEISYNIWFFEHINICKYDVYPLFSKKKKNENIKKNKVSLDVYDQIESDKIMI